MMKYIQRLIFLLVCLIFVSQAYGQEENKEENQGFRITQSPLTQVKLVYVKNNLCSGDSKGAIDISVSGGIPPYSYKWSNGSTTQDITGLKAGTYKVKVSDSHKCLDSLEVAVTESPKLDVILDSVADILCFGFKKGSIDITVKGGEAPYKYNWSNGHSTEDLHNVSAGTYSILISDANNCQEILSATIEQRPLIVRSIDDVKNIKCKGDSTGKVNITVSGGVPPYTYAWSNGAVTKNLNNVPAGKYDVIVTDANNCQEASTTAVIEPDKLALKVAEVNHIKCNGDKSGAISINSTGGMAPFKYKWNNGNFTKDITGVKAGSYTLNVIDANGCTSTTSAKIDQPEPLIVALSNLTNVSQFGGKDGAINITVEGGIKPYNYKWSHGPVTKDVKDLSAGSYSVMVSDGNGCIKNLVINIIQPQPLAIKLKNLKHVKCSGNKEGAIDVEVTGGVAPYQYNWSSGDKSEDLLNIVAGSYNLEVKDANGISQTFSAKVEEPELFSSSIESIENIACHGDQKGVVNITVKGGVSPYVYKWNNGAITEDLINVAAGEYSIEIKDANNCFTSLKATVKESNEVVVATEEIKNISCFGEKAGSINITVTGGVAPYVYSWSNGEASEDLKAVSAGDYSVRVTDAKGCIKTVNSTISQPKQLLVEKVAVKDVSCFGGSNGSVSIFVTGGVNPYAYSWSNGNKSKDLQGAVAGNYTVVVTDKNGCTNSLSANLAQPTKLIASVDNVTDIKCNGDSKGAVNISVSGAVAPYNYKWTNGAMSQDLVNIKAGAYSVQITDANGCKDTLTAKVNENPALVVNIDGEKNIKCYGESKGAVNISVKGGVAPYSYKWSNGAITQNIVDVPAASYSVSVSDAAGCIKVVNSKIAEPTLFLASIDRVTDVKCFGDSTGAIAISVKGGVAPYTYNWSNGASVEDVAQVKAGAYSLTVSDANNCTEKLSAKIEQPTAMVASIQSVSNLDCNGNGSGVVNISVKGGIAPYSFIWNNGAKTEDITNISAGSYSVKINDAYGCLKTLNTTITEPPALTVTLDAVKNINCFGDKKGAATISVKGGVAPYTYSWSNGAITEDIADVPAGDYTVRVTDSKGCIKTLKADIKQPADLVASIDLVKDILCFGDTTGLINISAKGGSLPYSFKWNNGSTTEDLKNLGAGSYSVVITDAKGCSEALSAKVTGPAPLVQNLESVKHVKCNGEKTGIINISVTGGTAPYGYNWSNQEKSQDPLHIGAGIYTVYITDANGCKGKAVTATINEPSALDVQVKEVTNISRYGENNGSVNLSVSGGVAPYKYSWSNGSSLQNLTNAAAGVYTCLVTDANGCLKAVNASVKQPTSMVASIENITHVRCYGENEGGINISVTGGDAPYTFSWSNGTSSEDISGVSAGTYSVTVTDANGSKQVLKASVNQPAVFALKIDAVKHLSCYNDNSGAITTTVTGGLAPYNFTWDNGARSQFLSGIPAGSYTITVTDKNGCKKSESVVINQPEPLSAKVSKVSHISCQADNKGAIDIQVDGGTKPYSYSWSNGAKSEDISQVRAGTFSVRILDAKGCIESLTETITEPEKLALKINSVKNNTCSGEAKGAIDLAVTGGVAPYSFKWNTHDSTRSIMNLKSGKYSVTVNDTNGCASTIDATVEEPKPLTVTIDNSTNITCTGESNGTVNIIVNGGVEPYTYSWNNGITSEDLANVEAGDYSVTVTDNNGCVNDKVKVNVSQPEVLTLKLDSVSNISCNNGREGAVFVAVSGGTKPYTYYWSNGAISQNLTGINAGSYTVKVKDKNGCMETLTAAVSEPSELTVALEEHVNLKCHGENNGIINIAVKGGVAPYHYKWSNGETSQNLNQLSGGDYSVVVNDAYGCKKELKATITQPQMLVKSLDAITHLRCFEDKSGEIHVSVSGGVAPYTYNWSNGAITQDIIDIPAGDYTLTITEGNGCVSTISASIEEPPLFVSEIVKYTDILCNGDKKGSIELNVSGGVPPYKYEWSNGLSTQNLSDLPASGYSAMITDANGCLNTVSVEISEPTELALKIDSIWTVKCCGDSSGGLFISVAGGVGPYKYQWSNGEVTEDIMGLKMGQYSVVVTDANSCTVSTPKEGMSLYDQIMSQGKFITRNILFDVGKSTIKAESFPEIMKIASVMREHAELMFSIEGHTDSDGDANSNKILSQDRAKAIKDALIKMGIENERLESKGYGQTKPIDTNATKEGKANNRRVEFVLITPGYTMN